MLKHGNLDRQALDWEAQQRMEGTQKEFCLNVKQTFDRLMNGANTIDQNSAANQSWNMVMHMMMHGNSEVEQLQAEQNELNDVLKADNSAPGTNDQAQRSNTELRRFSTAPTLEPDTDAKADSDPGSESDSEIFEQLRAGTSGWFGESEKVIQLEVKHKKDYDVKLCEGYTLTWDWHLASDSTFKDRAWDSADVKFEIHLINSRGERLPARIKGATHGRIKEHKGSLRYLDLRDLLDETEDPSLWKSVTKVMFEFDNSFSWSNNKYVELAWTRVKDAKHRTAQHGPPSMGAKVDDNVVIFHDPQRKISNITSKKKSSKHLDTGKDIKIGNGKEETMTI
jgi:hypothetical protein